MILNGSLRRSRPGPGLELAVHPNLLHSEDHKNGGRDRPSAIRVVNSLSLSSHGIIVTDPLTRRLRVGLGVGRTARRAPSRMYRDTVNPLRLRAGPAAAGGPVTAVGDSDSPSLSGTVTVTVAAQKLDSEASESPGSGSDDSEGDLARSGAAALGLGLGAAGAGPCQ
jgi:hypothetical protein